VKVRRDVTEMGGPSQIEETMPRPLPITPLPAPKVAPPQRAFAALFEREFSYVWRTLARLGIPEADREDLANEVFFQIYRQLANADLDRPLRPWIFAFAFRIASSHRRLARNRFERPEESVEAIDGAPSPHDALERREAQDLVDAGLGELSLDQRAVFVLHEIDGCDMPEVALALGIPLNTGYSRLRAARAKFTSAVRRIKEERGRS
jgi:RNA polymerase sigma-70 factor (ECF subfamily)